MSTERTPEALGQENFAIELTETCKTHAQWLSVMRFGMGTLLENQPLLINLIVAEAEREARLNNPTNLRVGNVARKFLNELGLRLVPA